MHIEAVGGDADLSGIGEFHRHREVEHLLDVGILEDDDGRIAAKLHRHALQGRRGIADHLLADGGIEEAGQDDRRRQSR